MVQRLGAGAQLHTQLHANGQRQGVSLQVHQIDGKETGVEQFVHMVRSGLLSMNNVSAVIPAEYRLVKV